MTNASGLPSVALNAAFDTRSAIVGVGPSPVNIVAADPNRVSLIVYIPDLNAGEVFWFGPTLLILNFNTWALTFEGDGISLYYKDIGALVTQELVGATTTSSGFISVTEVIFRPERIASLGEI